MSRPIIAVSAPLEVLDNAFGPIDYTTLTAVYTNAIYAAGGQPVVMPVVADPPGNLLSRMDGLMLTGGGDLDPSLYGEQPEESTYDVRKERDAFEVALYREAVGCGMPVLAICRGMHLVNVIRGGTLLQDVESEPSHWQQERPTRPWHAIKVAGGSGLAEVFGHGTEVNSYHHQALRELGSGLEVTAFCGDVIEGVEATDADVIGVQWHPEHLAATYQQQAELFAGFVRRSGEFRTTA